VNQEPATRPAPAPSTWRAWCQLIVLSVRRQARAHVLLWMALGLLACSAFMVVMNTRSNRWGIWYWRSPPRVGPQYSEYLTWLKKASLNCAWSPEARSLQDAFIGSCAAVVRRSGFYVFSNWVVFSVFVTFLLPIWSLSFAVEGLGREREEGNLIWLLTRPLSRPAIYLAKYLSILPWALGLNLGGFALLCLLAGEPGGIALRLYWPAVVWATLAFCALFHLFAVCMRRAAIVALLYAFFLETTLGNMPGYWKRLSISFYARCLMFDSAAGTGVVPLRPEIYLPVSGAAAWYTLVGLTLLLLAAGTIVFARREYLDAA
jgi:ABC-2 type transport system permease protein